MSTNDTTPAPAEFRNRRKAPFTMLANAMLRDPALSLRAKGLLGMMLSFPEDWTYYFTHLQTLSSDGRESYRGALKELIEGGYVTRTRTHGERGRIQYTYEVSDSATADGLPSTVDRQRLTASGKPPTTNKDQTKTKQTNTDKPPAEPLALPVWLSDELWGEWQQHRKELKKPVTPTSAKRLFSELERAKEKGHDPASLIETAIARGWQGVVIPDERSAKGSARRPQTQAEANQKFLDGMEETRAAIKGVFDE